MNEVIIQSTEDARQYFDEFIDNNKANVFTEESSGLDGHTTLGLVIQNLPAILTGITALISVLKSKNIAFKITKDGQEITNIEDVKS